MMSLEAIRQMSDEAAELAAQEGMVPYVIYDHDEVHRMPGGKNHDGRGFPFPHLGSHEPDGWVATDQSFFVDSSGFGADDEPALSTRQFNRELLELVDEGRSVGLAITDVGQFQLYVTVFERDE